MGAEDIEKNEKEKKKALECEDRLFNLFVTCLGIKPAKSLLFF